MKDSCRVHGTLENQFPDQHPHLESKIIKIGQDIPEVQGMLIFKNISKIVNFADWSGKRLKLSQEAQADFLTTLSAQNVCPDIGYNMEYV